MNALRHDKLVRKYRSLHGDLWMEKYQQNLTQEVNVYLWKPDRKRARTLMKRLEKAVY